MDRLGQGGVELGMGYAVLRDSEGYGWGLSVVESQCAGWVGESWVASSVETCAAVSACVVCSGVVCCDVL